jgi:hypothetical protein
MKSPGDTLRGSRTRRTAPNESTTIKSYSIDRREPTSSTLHGRPRLGAVAGERTSGLTRPASSGAKSRCWLSAKYQDRRQTPVIGSEKGNYCQLRHRQRPQFRVFPRSYGLLSCRGRPSEPLGRDRLTTAQKLSFRSSPAHGATFRAGHRKGVWVRRAPGLPLSGVSKRLPIQGPQRNRPGPANG